MSDDRGSSPVGRILESAGTLNSEAPVAPVNYRSRYHAGQRPPFHAIPALGCYLLLLVAAAAAVTYATRTYWWARAELVSTHGLLPDHRLNKLVTATAVEMGPQGRERLLVADETNLFLGSPIKSLRYWQWFPLEQFGQPLAGSTIRGLSASDGRVAIIPEARQRRGLLLGALPDVGSRPKLWDRPVIDLSYFPRVSDKNARAALFDRMSGDWLIGALNVGPYNRPTRQWKEPSLRDDAQVSELTSLGDGIIAALGAQGVDTLRWTDGHWRPVSHLGRTGDSGLRGSIPRFAQFGQIPGSPAGTGTLTYLSEAYGLGQIRLDGGRIESVDERIGEGRAHGITREALTRAVAGVDRASAWMLYRTDERDTNLGVAHYRFKQHRMMGLPAGQPISVGSDAIITPDPNAPQTAWVGGRGLFAVHARPNERLEAVDARLATVRVEEVLPARDTIFAATKSAKTDGTPANPTAVMAAPRDDALRGRGSAWSPFIGPRRLESPLALNDITAATDGVLNGHDSLLLGTRKAGIVAFDRVNRELFRPFTDSASAAIVAPGTLDLHSRGRSIVQVASDHSVNFYDGNAWQRLIAANWADLVPGRIRVAVAGESVLVLSDGQSNAVYDARTHEWYPLPPLEVSRMVVALNSLWAITPKKALYRLPFSDVKRWRPIDSAERVLDLHAQPDMLAVLGQRGDNVRLWVLKGDASEPKVVFESNESIGDPDKWQTFAVHGKQLFVTPHNGEIGRYDGETHRWSSIGLPPAASALRHFVVTDRGLWFVDARGLASFRPHDGNEWTKVADRAQKLRMGTDGHTVTIQTEDGRVLVGEDGANPPRTIVGGALSAAPEKISAGVFFKGSLIVASDVGVHRYDAERHDWENVSRADPIVEFAQSADALYARSRSGAVLLWNSDDLAGWEPATDANAKPLRAERLAGSGGSYVAAASRESGVSALFSAEPARAKSLLFGSPLRAAGTISAAVEIDHDLVIGTTGGAISIYGKTAAGQRGWTNDLAGPGQAGSVGSLLVPPGRSDRLIVVGPPQAQAALLVAERPAPDQPWVAPRPVLNTMKVTDAAVDAASVFAIDSREDAPVSLARFDLATRQETAIIGAAFPRSSGGRAPTRAIGIASLQPDTIWRSDQAGQVSAYNLLQHSWQQSSDIRDVDRFFNQGGKLWSWSRARGALAEHDGKRWRIDGSWREVANHAERLVLIGRDGNVVVRDGRDERTIVTVPAKLPVSSPADILAIGEHDGWLFIATGSGAVIAYEGATHRWQAVNELADVQQFASSSGGETFFARTAQGALWRLDKGKSWSQAQLPDSRGPDGEVAVDFRQYRGRLFAIDRNSEAVELAARLERLGARLDDEKVPPPLHTWRLDSSAGARLLRVLPDGSVVEVSLTAEGFGFDRVWAVRCTSRDLQLFTEDGLVRIEGDAPYGVLPNLDRQFVRPNAEQGTAEVFELASDGQTEQWLRTATGVWRHDGQVWRRGDEDLQGALEREAPKFWDDERLLWSRADAVTLKRPDGSVQLDFQVSSGRFNADQPSAIGVDRNGIVTLTRAGIVRYGMDFSWQHISWPGERPLADAGRARLVMAGAEVLLEIDNEIFRWSGQGWSQLGRTQRDAIAQSRASLLDGRLWRVSRRPGSSEIDIGMRIAVDQPFERVSLVDGRFDFEAVRDIVVASGKLCVATQFGMVEVDPATQGIKKLQRTERPVSRFATSEGTVAAQLEGGMTLVYRDAQWVPGGSRELFAETGRPLIQAGPWQWRQTPAGPKVQLDSEPGGGLRTASGPLEVRFSGNRFAFDDVREAAFAERPWLATAAGLIGRSGARWMQIDSAVPGQIAEGSGWSGAFAVGTPETNPVLFARLDEQVVMLVGGEWRPASDAIVERALVREQGVRNTNYEITRSGGRIQLRVKFADAAGRYVPVVFDRALRRFRHDMPSLVTRHPSDTPDGLLVATRGGILAINLDRNAAVGLYADPVEDGIGTEEVKALVHLPAVKRSLALLANGQLARFDTGATRWADAGAEDAGLLDIARRVLHDHPDGWRIESADNQPLRLAWRGQPAILVTESSGQDQARSATRFAHDIADSAFIEEGSIVIGTRGGIVRIPLRDRIASSTFVLRATDVLTPAELAQRTAPRGISFLRPGPKGADIFARREADGQTLRLSATSIQTVAPTDADLAASQMVARDVAWNWTKASGAPVQMSPSQVFRVSAGYKFLAGQTWSFLDIGQTDRRFPHRTMVALGDDLFIATVGGVSRFAASSSALSVPSTRPFITAVYGKARGQRGDQPMVDVVELFVTPQGQLVARTRANELFAFDPKKDEWEAVTTDANLAADILRVADTELLDWSFNEAGQQSIRVRPLLQDLKEVEQSVYPLFSNGRFSFDDVRTVLDVDGQLWLATGGGICIYNRDDFTPRRFVSRPFLGVAGAPQGPSVREMVRDPDRRDRIVARLDSGISFEADAAAADFRKTEIAAADGYDVFEWAYARKTFDPLDRGMRLIQYPFGSSRFPEGAVRARFRDTTGNWIELGKDDDRALPLFSNERFAFDDVSDAALVEGRLLVATPVGIVTNRIDWAGQRATMFSIDVAAAEGSGPAGLPALRDMQGIVQMPGAALVAWNNDRVFRQKIAAGRSPWQKLRDQLPNPVAREQLLVEPAAEWRILLGIDDAANVTRLVGGREVGQLRLGTRFGDVSHPVSDREWIYLPGMDAGLVRIEKAGIR
jgi:hypothetical protein